MKKTFIFLAFIGLFTFAAPKIADAADNCYTITLHCKNSSHYVVICHHDELVIWSHYYCGTPLN